MKKKRAWIFDIDGTVALNNDKRSPYDYEKSCNDDPCETARALYDALSRDYKIIFCSGREDSSRETTEKWLYKHGFINYEILHMRKTGDHRGDQIIKSEIYINEIEPYYEIVGVVDDRDRVVKAWRGLGLVCLQIREGNF